MKDHPGMEAALEITEAGLDQLANNQFLADIPVVGVAFKVCKVYSGIRERIYISKLTAFLSRLDSIPQEKQHAMISEVLTDSNERQKVGERLLMILEQLTDQDKPAIMAVFFIAYLRRVIDLPVLLRCWDAIESAYGGDLKILLGVTGEPAFGGGNSHLEYLVRSGLTTPKKSKLIGDDKIEYFVSSFGNLFINLYHENSA
jgi:hypothetical protein